MKKNDFLWAAVAFSALSIGFVSCSSDDEDDSTKETNAFNKGIAMDIEGTVKWESALNECEWISNFPEYTQAYIAGSKTTESVSNQFGYKINDKNVSQGELNKYKDALIKAEFKKISETTYTKDIFEGSLSVSIQEINSTLTTENTVNFNFTITYPKNPNSGIAWNEEGDLGWEIALSVYSWLSYYPEYPQTFISGEQGQVMLSKEYSYSIKDRNVSANAIAAYKTSLLTSDFTKLTDNTYSKDVKEGSLTINIFDYSHTDDEGNDVTVTYTLTQYEE